MKKLLVIFVGLLTACTGPIPMSESISKSNLTSGQVSMTLKKNVTTQAEIVELFGAPNIVTQNADGEDIWTYQRNATVASTTANSSSTEIIFFGRFSQSSGFEQSSHTMTLIIKFKDINGIKTVVDFSSRNSSF